MGDYNTDREQVFADVIRIMAETLEISPEEITADLNFNSDLPFDSFQSSTFVDLLVKKICARSVNVDPSA